ncbi:hypothetical protein GALL_533510 [mine drainage metagenome]|uniref:Uncharacterized protein n=1 Tax=mine drainage metagenome TaxID=410659 RepID=A0A1J5PC66_9ZZZZ
MERAVAAQRAVVHRASKGGLVGAWLAGQQDGDVKAGEMAGGSHDGIRGRIGRTQDGFKAEALTQCAAAFFDAGFRSRAEKAHL